MPMIAFKKGSSLMGNLTELIEAPFSLDSLCAGRYIGTLGYGSTLVFENTPEPNSYFLFKFDEFSSDELNSVNDLKIGELYVLLHTSFDNIVLTGRLLTEEEMKLPDVKKIVSKLLRQEKKNKKKGA